MAGRVWAGACVLPSSGSSPVKSGNSVVGSCCQISTGSNDITWETLWKLSAAQCSAECGGSGTCVSQTRCPQGWQKPPDPGGGCGTCEAVPGGGRCCTGHCPSGRTWSSHVCPQTQESVGRSGWGTGSWVGSLGWGLGSVCLLRSEER